MADLRLTYGDAYNEVSRFIGWGSSPTGTNLTDAQNVVKAGYRRFLYPIDQRTGRRHRWSFLIKQTSLTTVENTWQYPLPTDFNRLMTKFVHDTDSQYQDLIQTTAHEILHKRSQLESTNYPTYFAIQPRTYSAEYGTGWDVWFWEIPSGAFTMYYSYLINVPTLSNSTDYFVGGDLASETILETALGVAETRWNREAGVHYQEAAKLTQQMIEADDLTKADYYGVLTDPGLVEMPYERFLEDITDPYSS